MTDRELLEAAARAVNKGAWHPLTHDTPNGEWNPLTDDGDALRLAVRLRIAVEPWIHGDSACSRVACREILIDEPHYGDDPCAATRRAIVRAAAAMAPI